MRSLAVRLERTSLVASLSSAVHSWLGRVREERLLNFYPRVGDED